MRRAIAQISWEGQKEANQVWKSWKYSEWVRSHERKELIYSRNGIPKLTYKVT